MVFTAANFANELGFGMNNSGDQLAFDKASIASQVAGGFCSLWRGTGLPAQGAIPAAAAICNKALTGAFGFTNAGGGFENRLAWAYYNSVTTAGHAFELHDRLAHMGGLSGIVITAQAVTVDLLTLAVPAARLGDTSYKDVRWWIEWYIATGATGVNFTVNVTYSDNSTGNIVIAVPANTGASRAIPILPAVAGLGIKSINNVTLSATTGTAGSFGFTATRQLSAMENDVAGKGKDHSWAMLGAPVIPDDACLMGTVPCIATASGNVRGTMKLAKA